MKWYYAKDTNCAYRSKEKTKKEDIEITPQPDPGMVFDGEKWYLPQRIKENIARKERNRLLRETDYIMLPDYPLADKSAVIQYRQSLRDITQQKSFPDSVTWPEEPEEIKSIREVSTK